MMDNFFEQFLRETNAKVDAEIQEEQLKALANVGKPIFTVYKSFVDAGFTKDQALELIKAMLVSSINGTMKK